MPLIVDQLVPIAGDQFMHVGCDPLVLLVAIDQLRLLVAVDQ